MADLSIPVINADTISADNVFEDPCHPYPVQGLPLMFGQQSDLSGAVFWRQHLQHRPDTTIKMKHCVE